MCDAAFEDEDCNGQANESPPCETFRSITGGADYSCGISEGGRVLCWGANGGGQLGDGTLLDRSVPTEVIGLGTDTRSIATGQDTTCAVSNAGNVSCWGQQLHWVQGGMSGSSVTPVPATLFPPVLALAIGGGGACAILPDHTLACSDPFLPGLGVVGIAPVAGFEGIQEIAKGQVGVCGLMDDGSVRCWSGVSGEAPVAVPGLTGAVHISGDTRAACAVIADGSVRCWGLSEGYSGLGEAAKPAPLELVTVPGVSAAVEVFTDVFSGCALSGGGTVQCWGFGDEGEFARIAALQGVDLLASTSLGDRVFVRIPSGEVLGFSPTNRGAHPKNGNPTVDGYGPYRLMGP